MKVLLYDVQIETKKYLVNGGAETFSEDDNVPIEKLTHIVTDHSWEEVLHSNLIINLLLNKVVWCSVTRKFFLFDSNTTMGDSKCWIW